MWRRRSSSYLVHAFSLFLGIMWLDTALADCPTTSGAPQTINYGSLGISNSLPVGAVIPGSERSFRITGACASSSTFNKDIVACPVSGSAVAGMTGVYPTGHAGIGMRMRDQNGNPLVGTGSCATTSSLGKTDAAGKFDLPASFELVKTGPVATGPIQSATYNTGVLNTGYGLNGNNGNISVLSTVVLREVTCSVKTGTANQTISLPSASARSLASVGQTSERTPFQITMTCDPGIAISIKFESATADSGVASVLGSTGGATGVGVQLLDSTQKPVVLGQVLPLLALTTGNVTFPFFAQYYRLSAAIHPGPVNAAAIFTMSYQ